LLLVTAANGNQGKLLIPRLLAAGVTLRACVRSGESARLLRAAGAADIVVGDLLRAISKRYSSHDFIGNPNVLRWLLSREPTTFEQFVQREFDASTAA
jgi:nucleoside-diphosphate-sugar epimerase